MIMKIIIIGILMWGLLGAAAYFHAVQDRKRFNTKPRPFFLKDSWFYDSLLHGLIAFLFEFWNV